jgi:hypothetical protein
MDFAHVQELKDEAIAKLLRQEAEPNYSGDRCYSRPEILGR